MSSARMPPSRAPTGTPASGSRRAGRAAAAPCRPAGGSVGATASERQQRPRPAAATPAACRLTTPSAASSSHRPAWKRLIRSAAGRRVRQRPRLVDQLAQRLQLGLVEGEVARRRRAAVRVSPRPAPRRPRRTARSRPSTVIVTPRSNQSRSPPRPWSRRRSCSESRDLAVVGRLAGDLDREAGVLRQPRELGGGELGAVDALRRRGGRIHRAAGAVEQAQVLEARAGQVEPRQQGSLGGEIAVARAVLIDRERDLVLVVADHVRPAPGQLERVPGAVVGAQHEFRRGDRGRRVGAVGGHDGCDVAQRRRVQALEAAARLRRDLEAPPAQQHPLQGLRHGPGQTHQPQPALGPMRAYQAFRADEQQRAELADVRAQLRDDTRALRTDRDVEHDLAGQHVGQLVLAVQQHQAHLRRLLQQREHARAAGAEVECFLGAHEVAPEALPGPLREVQLARQLHVVGAVALAQPGLEGAPIEPAVDPTPTRAGAHQPGQQPRSAPGDRAHGQLDRQRPADRRDRRRFDQRAQRCLPRRRAAADLEHRRRARGAQRGGGGARGFPATSRPASLRGDDHDRRHVLAVEPNRARTGAVLERQGAVAGRHERRDRPIQGAVPDHRAGQRVGVGVPCGGDHAVTARVRATAFERPRP